MIASGALSRSSPKRRSAWPIACRPCCAMVRCYATADLASGRLLTAFCFPFLHSFIHPGFELLS